MKYTDTKSKAYMVKLMSITLTVFLLIFTLAASGILLSAEPETTAEETEGDTTESNPPMTGETEIVYERAPRTIRIIDIASISNPNGYYTGEETEYKETTGVPQTQPETQSVTSQPAEITETQNINTVENGQEKFKFDSKAVLAVGTVFIIIVLFTAVVIFVRQKHPSLIIEKNNSDDKNSADSSNSAQKDKSETGKNETNDSETNISESVIDKLNDNKANNSETSIDEPNNSSAIKASEGNEDSCELKSSVTDSSAFNDTFDISESTFDSKAEKNPKKPLSREDKEE